MPRRTTWWSPRRAWTGVRVTYQKSFLDRAETVERTIERHRIGLNNDVEFAENSQFTTATPREPRYAKVVLPVGDDAGDEMVEGEE